MTRPLAAVALVIALHAAMSPGVRAEPGQLRVADPLSWPGYRAAMEATYGGIFPDTSLRFDPADSFDVAAGPPRPFSIERIHFLVEAGEGMGSLRVQLHETNGGEKPDEARVLLDRTISAGPGENIIDLVALGAPVLIDPPRMLHLTFRGQGVAGAPLVAADDGLPFVGGAGDFHTAVRYRDGNCNVDVFGFAPPSDGAGSHSSNLMAWLDVDFIAPAPATLFVLSAALPGCSRCAWGDFDGDGDPDALDTGNRLYRNDGGGSFTEITDPAFAPGRRGCSGGQWADHDSDSDLDFLCQTADCHRCPTDNPIPQGARNFDTIFRNEGDRDGDTIPEFTDIRAADFGNADDAPLPGDFDPTEGAAWGDFNGDGHLDVYLANHNDWTTYEAFRDHIYINDGPPAFTYTDASAASGVSGALLHGRGVAPADHDGDGDTDIFVTNYVLDPDLLWENRGVNERDLPVLVDVAAARGVQGLERGGAHGHGIGAAWGDVSGDGNLDLLVGNLAHSAWLCFSDTTKLFISDGGSPPAYTDIRPASGLPYVEVHSDASFADFDNDADLDVVITHVYDGWRTTVQENLGTDPPTFRDVFATSGVGQRSAWGSAWADVEGDGDLDFWDAGGLYLNQTAGRPDTHWIQVRLRATRSNPQSIGARLRVESGARAQVTEIFGGRGTGSQDDFTRHFGLGADTMADRITVTWPSGCTLEVLGVPADQIIDLDEPTCLVPAFTVTTAASGFDPRRPSRIACVGEIVRFADASLGTVLSHAWDLDGDTVVDSTLPDPTFTYTAAGLVQVTLTVDDGSAPRSVTKPIRIDAPPAAPTNPLAAEANFCISDMQIAWDRVDFGAQAPGVYNVYRGVDAADAMSRPPLVTGLTVPAWLDERTYPGQLSTYVIEAEDARIFGGCSPGPHHGGSTARTALTLTAADQVQVPHFSVAAAADADPCVLSGNLVTWEAAEFLDPTGTGVYNVYRAEGRCPDSTRLTGDPPLVTGLTSLSWLDASALPGVAYTYLVQAEDNRRSALCRRGPSNGGATTSVCAGVDAVDAEDFGSADPGAALRVAGSAAAVSLDWSSTTQSPQVGEAWGMLVADAPRGPWSLLPPGRLAAPATLDSAAAGIPLRCYRATILSPGNCPAR